MTAAESPARPRTDLPQHRDHAQTARRARLTLIALLIADGVAALVILGLALDFTTLLRGNAPALLAVLAAPIILRVAGCYNLAPQTHRLPLFLRTAIAATCCLWFATTIEGGALAASGRVTLLAATGGVALSWYGFRILARRSLRAVSDRTLVVGTGAVASQLVALAKRYPDRGLRIVGFVDDDPLELPPGSPPVLGSVDDLAQVCRFHEIERIVVAFTPRSDNELVAQLRTCDGMRIRIDVVPRLFDLLPLAPTSLGALALTPASRQFPSIGRRMGKRVFDLSTAMALSVLLAPLMLGIALAIRLDDGGSVFYRQTRIGRNGKPFRIWKFRTMLPNSDRIDPADSWQQRGIVETARDQKLGREKDITRLGAILRRSSLDELPQLWNVASGEMSLVGPRPLRDYEVEALEPWQDARLDVLPGITGLWQVLGRSDIEWHERMQLDYAYARHQSLGGDASILLQTLPAIVAKRGAV